ncbi:hypothetical protein M2322_000859 [Rhodoblastus acidophilus]|uniref:hypothetical protein n=1 Tax=Rhodoblastus acidophilus TaxID=1074 RepID=UPI0022249C1B|nr:hypothetical protein [Rhodoblastus acidophilus]MCW2315325.1 hypothetical protein [Rhodoblastus acidophilus]
MLKRLAFASAMALALSSAAICADVSFSVGSGQTKVLKDAGDGTYVDRTFDVSYATRLGVYSQITVTTTATTLNALLAAANISNSTAFPLTAAPSWATAVYVTPSALGSGVSVRYRCDGVAPTAALGEPIQAGQSWPLAGPAGAIGGACQFVSATGAAVTVDLGFRG